MLPSHSLISINQTLRRSSLENISLIQNNCNRYIHYYFVSFSSMINYLCRFCLVVPQNFVNFSKVICNEVTDDVNVWDSVSLTLRWRAVLWQMTCGRDFQTSSLIRWWKLSELRPDSQVFITSFINNLTLYKYLLLEN